MNIVKRCYDWVLSWAQSPWGATALFVLAFAESSFLNELCLYNFSMAYVLFFVCLIISFAIKCLQAPSKACHAMLHICIVCL